MSTNPIPTKSTSNEATEHEFFIKKEFQRYTKEGKDLIDATRMQLLSALKGTVPDLTNFRRLDYMTQVLNEAIEVENVTEGELKNLATVIRQLHILARESSEKLASQSRPPETRLPGLRPLITAQSATITSSAQSHTGAKPAKSATTTSWVNPIVQAFSNSFSSSHPARPIDPTLQPTLFPGQIPNSISTTSNRSRPPQQSARPSAFSTGQYPSQATQAQQYTSTKSSMPHAPKNAQYTPAHLLPPVSIGGAASMPTRPIQRMTDNDAQAIIDDFPQSVRSSDSSLTSRINNLPNNRESNTLYVDLDSTEYNWADLNDRSSK